MHTRKRFTKNEIQEMIRLTSFLPSDAENTQRKWHIENNIYTIPKCKICNNIVKWYRQRFKYSKYCSKECSLGSPERLEKTKATNILKFGTEYAIGSRIVRDKIKQTNIEKYGVENPLQNENIQEKIKQTNIEKYGVHTTLLVSHVQEKIKQTNIERYGVENPLQNQDIQHKVRQTNVERYGVETPSQNENIQEKIKQTNIERYGVENPLQNQDIQHKVRQTNVERYGVENPSQKHFSVITKKCLTKEWLYEEYSKKKRTTTEIANQLNIHHSTISDYINKHSIELNIYKTSLGEKEIYSFLLEYNIQSVSNDRSIISPLELDIYLPDYNIAIEYCGLYWHSELHKTKDYHKDKYIKCKEQGIRLITIYENEWIYNKDIVKSKILNLLHLHHDKIFARKCSINDVSTTDKTNFYNNYHIQGSGPGSINIGLYYKDILVACMSFIKQKNDVYVLNRYATLQQVVGGFSRLLKHFIKTYFPRQIITFADLRWSNGDLYKKNNFIEDGVIEPDYQYIIRDRVYHKFGFRHAHLKNKLLSYNPDLTEHQNCLNNKIYRIYDCGKIRFVYDGLK